VPRPGGGLETVSGSEETIQRVLMRLEACRGKFFPQPDYGSRLHELGGLKASQRPAAARQYIAEALAEESGVKISAVEYIPGEGDSAVIKLSLVLGGGEETGLSINI